jgi:hypothetical protein
MCGWEQPLDAPRAATYHTRQEGTCKTLDFGHARSLTTSGPFRFRAQHALQVSLCQPIHRSPVGLSGNYFHVCMKRLGLAGRIKEIFWAKQLSLAIGDSCRPCVN